MIHSVLTGLPEFVDYGQVQDSRVQGNADPELAKALPEHSNYPPQPDKVVHSPATRPIAEPGKAQSTLEADFDLCAPIDGPASESFSPNPPTTGVNTMTPVGSAGVLSDSAHSPPHNEGTPIPVISDPSVPPSSPQQVIPIFTPSHASTFLDPADIPLPPSPPSTPPASAELSPPTTAHSLSSVLLLADQLSSRFPPGTPELRLTHTLGPASAMRTWAQDASQMPSDEQAEAFVVSGVDIVIHEAPEPDPQTLKEQKAQKKRKQKVRKETRLLVASAVIVLGVAVVYGVRAHHGGGGGGLGTETEWRALVGALGALGDRVLGAFGDAHIEL